MMMISDTIYPLDFVLRVYRVAQTTDCASNERSSLMSPSAIGWDATQPTYQSFASRLTHNALLHSIGEGSDDEDIFDSDVSSIMSHDGHEPNNATGLHAHETIARNTNAHTYDSITSKTFGSEDGLNEFSNASASSKVDIDFSGDPDLYGLRRSGRSVVEKVKEFSSKHGT